jgi:hypothetical protein
MPIQFKWNPSSWGLSISTDTINVNIVFGYYPTEEWSSSSFSIETGKIMARIFLEKCYSCFRNKTHEPGGDLRMDFNFCDKPPLWLWEVLDIYLADSNCFTHLNIDSIDPWWQTELYTLKRVDVLCLDLKCTKYQELIIDFPFTVGELSIGNFSAIHFSAKNNLASCLLISCEIGTLNLVNIKFLSIRGNVKVVDFINELNLLGLSLMFMSGFSFEFLQNFKNLEALHVDWLKSPKWTESDFEHLTELNYLSISNCASIIDPIMAVTKKLMHIYLVGVLSIDIFETLLANNQCKSLCVSFKQQKHQKIYEAKMLEHPDVTSRLPFCYINNFHRNKDKGYWYAGYAE